MPFHWPGDILLTDVKGMFCTSVFGRYDDNSWNTRRTYWSWENSSDIIIRLGCDIDLNEFRFCTNLNDYLCYVMPTAHFQVSTPVGEANCRLEHLTIMTKLQLPLNFYFLFRRFVLYFDYFIALLRTTHCKSQQKTFDGLTNKTFTAWQVFKANQVENFVLAFLRLLRW